MSKIYVLDACALIAMLSNEKGADKVVSAYNEAASGSAELVMNIINLLEVYYGDYRVHGKAAADKMIDMVNMSPIKTIFEIGRDVFAEAGRLKATYKISLADSIVLAQSIVLEGELLTADHHEFDAVKGNEPLRFHWIR